MPTVVVHDGDTASDVIASLDAVCDGLPREMRWDLSGLGAVPWLEIPQLAVCLARRRRTISASISSSTVVVPSATWRRAIDILLSLYTPCSPVTVVVQEAG